MEFEIQNMFKLKCLEKKLSALLEEIDKEIIQTDVEWLHLKNIAEVHKSYENTYSKSEFINTAPSTTPARNIKTENIDDDAINSIILNLSPIANNFGDGGEEEEFDSD